MRATQNDIREREHPADVKVTIRLKRQKYDECFAFEPCEVCGCEEQLGVRITATSSTSIFVKPKDDVMLLCVKCATRIGRAVAKGVRR